MNRYRVYFDGDRGLVTDEGGGFDITATDEETAVRLFRLWYRGKVATAERQREAEERRARLRLVDGEPKA